MKLDDIKWALGEIATAIVHGAHRNCDCHPRLNYQPRTAVDLPLLEDVPAAEPDGVEAGIGERG